MGRRRRMDDKAFYIRDVGEKRENLQAVNKPVRFRRAAFDLKCEDRFDVVLIKWEHLLCILSYCNVLTVLYLREDDAYARSAACPFLF